MRPMSAIGTRAVAALHRAGVDHAVHRYEPTERHGARRSDRPAYGLDAAAALGLSPSVIGKTLVVAADGVLMLAIVPADRSLDLKAFAAAVGAHRATLAESRHAERATGYLTGGISPIGTLRCLRTLLDARAADLATIYVSGGRRGLQVSLRPADLVRLVDGEVIPISSQDL
ncbi:MAG: aminoacyl-tRNA deacylase [Chloroflexi bacterium]|nr:aminoacyl-tRNA deacylase [Chloroflexota bacterium]